MSSDPLVVVARLADVFDQLGIRYLVGGSLASSVYGIPRATNDVDLVADIRRMHVRPFQDALGSDFYFAEELILEAILNRSLDFDYLEASARALDIADLLALAQASAR